MGNPKYHHEAFHHFHCPFQHLRQRPQSSRSRRCTCSSCCYRAHSHCSSCCYRAHSHCSSCCCRAHSHCPRSHHGRWSWLLASCLPVHSRLRILPLQGNRRH